MAPSTSSGSIASSLYSNAAVNSSSYDSDGESAYQGSEFLRMTPRARMLTMLFGKEPFERLNNRVQALWKSIGSPKKWQKKSQHKSFFESRIGKSICSNKILGPILRRWTPTTSTCEVDDLQGGGFNRIIGITIPETEKAVSKVDRNLILRIPRDDFARPDREVATLEYLRNQTTIPVPQVLTHDFTRQNPLGEPFVIQRRIPGNDLGRLWSDLTHEQRCSAARDVGKTLAKLQTLTNPVPGIIDTVKAVGKGRGRTEIVPQTVPYELVDTKGAFQDPGMDLVTFNWKSGGVSAFLRHQIRRWKAAHYFRGPAGTSEVDMIKVWDSLDQAAQEMDKMGLFKDDTNCLCHLDFHARNIMAEVQEDRTLKITGYLDWDSAIFAPRFVGCAPPFWMWCESEAPWNEEDERGANVKPQDEELAEIKQIFEEAAGPEVLHYAYGQEFRLARMLHRLVREGIWGPQSLHDVYIFMTDWNRLRSLLVASNQ